VGTSEVGATRVRPSTPAKLVLIALGIALAVVLCEAAVRVLAATVPAIGSATTIANFQTYHPVYGFFHRPGASGWIHTPEFTSFVQINSRGLRDAEIAPSKMPGVVRVLVLGDSIVEAAQVPLEQTVAKQLQLELSWRLGRPVEAINAGNAGFGTGQSALFLEREGWGYTPDLVVLVFFVDNDVADNGLAVGTSRGLDTTRRPFFVPDGEGLRLIPPQSPSDDGLEWIRAAARRVWLTFNLAEQLLLWDQRREQEAQQIGKNRPTYLVEPPAEWIEAWLVTDRLLGRIAAESSARGVPFVVAVGPSNFQLNESLWRWLVAGDTRSRDGRRYVQDAPNRRLASIAERRSLSFVDILPAFRRAADKGLFFPDDGHWTPDGHVVAAREIADYVVANGLLAAR
jgi:hypothetical protein